VRWCWPVEWAFRVVLVVKRGIASRCWAQKRAFSVAFVVKRDVAGR
jgi:hypothetical protein